MKRPRTMLDPCTACMAPAMGEAVPFVPEASVSKQDAPSFPNNSLPEVPQRSRSRGRNPLDTS